MATSQRDAGLKHGWRSGLEEALGDQLDTKEIPYLFEKLTLEYLPLLKKHKYKPDFLLRRNGIVIESKGRFVTADRQKHKAIKQQYPDLDLRFVFSNPNQKIGKRSKTTYAMWCESNGFKYAKGKIPEAWLNEPPNLKSLALIERLLHE